MHNWRNYLNNLLLSNRKTLLIVIILISIILRLFSALYLGNKVEELPGTFDQISYHNLAQRVLVGSGFTFGQNWWPITKAGEPTAHWSYLYTLYLTVVYSIFGVNPLVARILQAVIVGVLHPYFIYLLSKKMFGEIVGIVAALITALYIYFIYYSATLMTEAFYITSILGGFLLSIKFADVGHTKNRIALSMSLGSTLAVSVLFRQLFLIFIPFLLIWLTWVNYRKTKRLPLAEIGAVIVTIGLVILPFTFFNFVRFNRIVLLNTNSGYAFYWGNHPVHGRNFVPILTPDMGSYQELIPEELHDLDEAALDQELLKMGVKFVLENPKRFLFLSLSRIPVYFMFWPTSDSSLISNVSRTFSFGLFLPFMLFGMTRSFYIRFSSKSKSFYWFLGSVEAIIFAFIIVYTIIHLLVWALIRYRLPIDAVLISYAGFGLVTLSNRGIQLLKSRYRIASHSSL